MPFHSTSNVKIDADRIIKILFDTPGVVNLSDSDEYEVQPGVYSSVYINLKAAVSNPSSRIKIAKYLAERVANLGVDYVCGMELGGCYFASHVADALNAELLFYRKSDKKYNIKNCFAGNVPRPDSHVLIVDDVLSSGNTIQRVVRELTEIGCVVTSVSIFSYCWDEEIAHNLKVSVDSLSNAEDLIRYGEENSLIKAKNIRLIKEYVAREEARLVAYQDMKEL